MGPPNILFLLTDQQRFDTLTEGVSPNLRRLAAQGAEFLHAYVSAPVCTPARSAILTGRSTWGHGLLAYGNGRVGNPYDRTMPATLSALGYHTAVVGKNHFGRTDSGALVAHGYQTLVMYDGLSGLSAEHDDYNIWFQQELPGEDPLRTGGLGWNTWGAAPYVFDEMYHPTSWTGREAIELIRSFASEGQAPFFLKVSFHRPHSPYDPPQRLLDITPALSTSPSISTDGWDEQYKYCDSRGNRDQWCGVVDDSELDLTRRAYLALVTHVDEWIGAILDALNETGFANNTFILFTSDHGDEQMDHYLWKKGYPYEGSTHVPMIVHWPDAMDAVIDVERGSTVSGVVEMRDIFPTFLDVSGGWIQGFEGFEGRPLTWLLRNETHAWRQFLDLELGQFYIGSWNAITDGRMKYIFHSWYREEQLFNLTEDPREQRDLAGVSDYGPELALWRGRLVDQFLREERGVGWVWGRRLMPRPWIPCSFGPNYPEQDVRRVICSVASSISWPVLMALCCLLMLVTLCCCCCACRCVCRRWRSRCRRHRLGTGADAPESSDGKQNHEPPDSAESLDASI